MEAVLQSHSVNKRVSIDVLFIYGKNQVLWEQVQEERWL